MARLRPIAVTGFVTQKLEDRLEDGKFVARATRQAHSFSSRLYSNNENSGALIVLCGIAGILGPGAGSDQCAAMTRRLHHRGPDSDGLWEGTGIVFGHRRLRVLDLTDTGAQPMTTPDGRYTIVYNGEVYNYREITAALGDISFRGTSDTEVVLHAYARWGPDCLTHFVGMFAFAIWDSHERTLFCARDRLGIKPFYFAELEGRFLFASEIGGLLAGGVEPRPNDAVIYDFLARDFYEHNDETFFAGIRKLGPGCWMTLQADGSAAGGGLYWSLSDAVATTSIEEKQSDRAEHLASMMTEAVKLHLQSDVPIGIAVSGGLDSSVLLSLIGKTHPTRESVEAFSAVFDDPQYSERPFVEELVESTGHKPHFVNLSPDDFIAQVTDATLVQDEPFAGVPIVAYARCIAQMRRNGCIVIMDGTGIDEWLAGYDRFMPAYWADLSAAGKFANLEHELRAVGVRTSLERAQAVGQIEMAASASGDVGIGQDLTRSVRPECIDAGFAADAYVDPPDFDRPFSDNLSNLMFREIRYTKLPRALRFRDRISMAVGCELRPPFLDHRLIAYGFALPAGDKIERGEQKILLRKAMKGRIPAALRNAPKRSVQAPQREWFRGPLREWVRDSIDTKKFWERGWIDRDQAIAALEGFQSSEGGNSFFIWQWINLAIWAEEFLDRAVLERAVPAGIDLGTLN